MSFLKRLWSFLVEILSSSEYAEGSHRLTKEDMNAHARDC